MILDNIQNDKKIMIPEYMRSTEGKMIKKLTNSFVEKVQKKNKRFDIRDSIVTGLILRVEPSGKKTWLIDYKRPDGRRNTKKIGDAKILTVMQAREIAKEKLAIVTLGEDPGEKEKIDIKTLSDLINIYAEWVIPNRKTGAYNIQLLKRAFDVFLEKDIDSITLLEVEKWRTKQRSKNFKLATINRKTTALKTLFNWSVRHGLVPQNPIKNLSPFVEVDSDKKIRYLSEEERGKLFQALNARENELKKQRKNHNEWLKARGKPLLRDLNKCFFADHLKPAVLLALNTGIRRGALFSLRWEDINFKEETLTLNAENSKTNKRQIVPMNEIVKKTLFEWQKQTKSNGKVFEISDCRSSWDSILKKAGIKNFRWHDMRHDFASRLVMAGVDLNTVRELLGHSDLKMTLRYAHLSPNVKKKAVDLLK